MYALPLIKNSSLHFHLDFWLLVIIHHCIVAKQKKTNNEIKWDKKVSDWLTVYKLRWDAICKFLNCNFYLCMTWKVGQMSYSHIHRQLCFKMNKFVRKCTFLNSLLIDGRSWGFVQLLCGNATFYYKIDLYSKRCSRIFFIRKEVWKSLEF